MKDKLHCLLLASIIAYFSICMIGRRALDAEQIEETELHIKVLKLQLSAYEDTVRPPDTPVNAITPPDTTTDAYEWADGLEGVELKEFYEGGYGL